MSRLRRPDPDVEDDPEDLTARALDAIAADPALADLELGIRGLGHGLLELTGTVADPADRDRATEVVQQVPGADVVVNRILVAGIDTNDQPAASISSRQTP